MKTPARIASVVYTRPDGSLLMRRRYYVPAGFNTYVLHQKFPPPDGCGSQVIVEGQAKPEHGWSERLVPLNQAKRQQPPELSGPPSEPESAPRSSSDVEPARDLAPKPPQRRRRRKPSNGLPTGE